MRRGRGAGPACWTRTSFFAFTGLGIFLVVTGAWFLAARFAPQALVVVRSCTLAHPDAAVGAQHCTVSFRHDGVADLIDLETVGSYPRGHSLVVHVTGGGTLVQAEQVDGGMVFLPLGALPLLLVLRWGWPPSAAARARREVPRATPEAAGAVVRSEATSTLLPALPRPRPVVVSRGDVREVPAGLSDALGWTSL